jgi:hypothetical protein
MLATVPLPGIGPIRTPSLEVVREIVIYEGAQFVIYEGAQFVKRCRRLLWHFVVPR